MDLIVWMQYRVELADVACCGHYAAAVLTRLTADDRYGFEAVETFTLPIFGATECGWKLAAALDEVLFAAAYCVLSLE